MLHAAAMLIGLFVLALVLTQRWSSGGDLAALGALALACVAIAVRFGGVARNPFSALPQMLALMTSQAPRVMAGALGAIRAALAADVTLKPALVRVKAQTDGAFARAAFTDAVSAAPGAVAVESDADGMLIHVIDEDRSDAAAFAALQRQTQRALGEGR